MKRREERRDENDGHFEESEAVPTVALSGAGNAADASAGSREPGLGPGSDLDRLAYRLACCITYRLA
jgi:hypothetical protein